MLGLLVSDAMAQTAAAAPQQSPLMSLVPFVLIFGVMYFFMIRPQKKKMQEEQTFLSKLAQGDDVFTKSGVLGRVAGLNDKVVTLELEGGSKMKVLKSHIGGAQKALFQEAKK